MFFANKSLEYISPESEIYPAVKQFREEVLKNITMLENISNSQQGGKYEWLIDKLARIGILLIVTLVFNLIGHC